MISRADTHDDVTEFERAWNDPRHTRAVQPPTDINQVLRQRYRTGEPLVFTRAMLWDLEQRKARDPGVYIPHVVQVDSDRSWALPPAADGAELLARFSQPRLWLLPDQYGLVLERAHLDHDRQAVTFTGHRTLAGPDGRTLVATSRQPLFHVEHAVGGSEEGPLNLWRIVHLTDAPDQQLTALFSRIWASPWLPEFVEIYIQRDLHIVLHRR
ncbi:MAG TPA: hypothetical protein VMC83_24325 [Streptosporangiaceae bacterium]|nr:hypothetical protein [Streptosporangiaceae bacterium]